MAIGDLRRPAACEPMFEARAEITDGLARLQLAGELDIAAIPLLEHEYGRIEDQGSTVIVLDLEGLEFIDAAGLGAILGAAKSARTNGRALRVVGAGPHVRKVFDLTGNTGLLAPRGVTHA